MLPTVLHRLSRTRTRIASPVRYASTTLDIKMPDMFQPAPEPVQIPFVFDHWESSRVKAAESSSQPKEAAIPKLNVVSRTGTQPADGLSHNLYHSDNLSGISTTPSTSTTSTTDVKKTSGLWADVVEDLGLPTSFNVGLHEAEKTIVDALPEVDLSGGKGKNFSRDLEKDEVKGLWVLLGVFTGSWIVGGLFRPSS